MQAAVVRLRQTAQYSDKRRFAGAVFPKKGMNGALGDRKTYTVERSGRAVALSQVIDPEGELDVSWDFGWRLGALHNTPQLTAEGVRLLALPRLMPLYCPSGTIPFNAEYRSSSGTSLLQTSMK